MAAIARFLSSAALIVLMASAPAACKAQPASDNVQPVAGTASVIDGDTIEIHGNRIRLSGFDTPERGARCEGRNVYQAAALALSDFIGTQTVICSVSGTDRYDRLVATCKAAGIDLGRHMVREGWGRDWPRYSGGAYRSDEAGARAAGRGLWGLACPDDLWGDRAYD